MRRSQHVRAAPLRRSSASCSRTITRRSGLTPEQAKPGTTLREVCTRAGGAPTERSRRRISFVTAWGDPAHGRDPEAGGWAIHLVVRRLMDGGLPSTHRTLATNSSAPDHQAERAADRARARANVATSSSMRPEHMLGPAMYDSTQLVMCNRRYAEMWLVARAGEARYASVIIGNTARVSSERARMSWSKSE
jgi:hypothetical protein